MVLKPTSGLNTVSSFYLESENKDQIIFNMINKHDNDYNVAMQSNFFYQGNVSYVNAKYHSYYGRLSQNWNKYSIIWFPEYYEWRFNNVLLRRLNKNETDNFPDAPSRIKFSLSEGIEPWSGRGIKWNHAPFEYQILSVQRQCNSNSNSNSRISIFMILITIVLIFIL